MTGDTSGKTPLIAPTVEGVDNAPAWPPVRHPFQVSSMGAFTTLGAGWFVNKPSEALSGFTPQLFVWCWAAILVLSGVCGIVAALTARSDEGLSLLTERMALAGVGSFSLIYTTALVATYDLGPWLTEVLMLLFLIACVWRYIQVQKRISWNKKVGRDTRLRWAR